MTTLDRARASLEGLSVGDAFGQRFFVHPDLAAGFIKHRMVPSGGFGFAVVGGPKTAWTFTDDTMMALSVYACLIRLTPNQHNDIIGS